MDNTYEFFIAGRTRNKENILKLCEIFDEYNISYYCFLKNEKSFKSFGNENQNIEEKQQEFEKLGLKSQVVLNIFNEDMNAEKKSKNLLLVLPAGKSGHIEAGVAYGLGKKCYAIGEFDATDSLYNIFEQIFSNEEDLRKFLKNYNKKARENQNINLRKLNLIVVFNEDLNKVLFCIRAKEPYKGLYNFVGGKVEENESNYEAAYRELFEETGICRNDIELDHFMDLNYFKYQNNLQVFYGILKHEVTLVEEKNKLEWVVINDELLNNEKFAGNYNIPHIIRQIKTYLKNGNNIL